MAERSAFARYVGDALGRLHDRRYLEGHPLGELLGGAKGLDAAALQRVLLDAIRELRPPDPAPYREADWRRYRHLVLRYVEAVAPADVARQLGVSERQARRDHHEAVEAVVDLLQVRQPDGAGEPAELAPDVELDDELARVGAAPTKPVQLVPILRDAVETVAPLAASRGTRIDAELPSDLPPVAADAGVLRHVLVSLLSAGVDRDPESTVCVRIASLDREVETRVVVRRRWPGRRGLEESSLGTDHAASLRAAARLAQMQGGSLEWGETDDGELVERLRLKMFRPVTVLMVDDNPDFVRLFRRYVAGEPYRIIEAKIADEAVPLAASVHPDLLMLDVMMPSMDGWRILQQLKREPATRDIPVVICSVLRERALAHSLGAVDLLPKPITQSTLLACLARHCAAPVAAVLAGSASPRPPSALPNG